MLFSIPPTAFAGIETTFDDAATEEIASPSSFVGEPWELDSRSARPDLGRGILLPYRATGLPLKSESQSSDLGLPVKRHLGLDE